MTIRRVSGPSVGQAYGSAESMRFSSVGQAGFRATARHQISMELSRTTRRSIICFRLIVNRVNRQPQPPSGLL
jgi:hypothetical protein